MRFDETKLRQLEAQQVVLKMIFNNEADLKHRIVNTMVSKIITEQIMGKIDVRTCLERAKAEAGTDYTVGRHSVEVFERLVYDNL